MIQESLLKVPSQTAFETVESSLFRINIYEFNGLTYADVSIDDELAIAGARCLANKWILPDHIGKRYGNLRFESNAVDSENYVSYAGFMDMFKLMIYTHLEYEEMV